METRTEFWNKHLEPALALAIAALIAVWASYTQRPTAANYVALEDYWRLAQQFAAGERLHAEVPFVYRIAVPWMASRIAPSSLRGGFLAVNVGFGLLTAPLLVLWLRRFVTRRAVRLIVVLVYAATWLDPLRFPFANPAYVDPPFVALVIVCLIAMNAVRTSYSAGVLGVVSACVVAGTFVRETMLLVPLAWLFADDPIAWRGARTNGRRSRMPFWARALPLVLSLVVLAAIHIAIRTDGDRTFLGAALQWAQKPASSYLLAWLTVFGPLIALPLYDWRRSARFLAEHEALLAFLSATAVLAWIGGADTERFLCWVMPVVYVLVGTSLERHWDALTWRPLAIALVLSQAVAARVFWSIPDVDGGTPAPLGASASLGERVYGFLDRLFVIDGFYWNLWSSFGSAGFRLIRLALFGTTVLLLLLAIRYREGAASVD